MASRAANFFSESRKIVCVGRNFAKHARELGNPVPKAPILFLKPASSMVRAPGPVLVPPSSLEVHHEVELGVVMGARARDATAEEAMRAVAGYVLALDMTARDVQGAAKKAGLPWSVAKGYDTFCPVGEFIPRERVPDPQALELWLSVDGVERQRGTTADMIFGVADLLSHISTVFTLEEGDVVLTGTPEGVGPVRAGQRIACGITGLASMEFDVAQRRAAL